MIRKSIVETSYYLTGNRPKVITGNRLLFLIVKCGSRALYKFHYSSTFVGFVGGFSSHNYRFHISSVRVTYQMIPADSVKSCGERKKFRSKEGPIGVLKFRTVPRNQMD